MGLKKLRRLIGILVTNLYVKKFPKGIHQTVRTEFAAPSVVPSQMLSVDAVLWTNSSSRVWRNRDVSLAI
jgi:hypothetical protein